MYQKQDFFGKLMFWSLGFLVLFVTKFALYGVLDRLLNKEDLVEQTRRRAEELRQSRENLK